MINPLFEGKQEISYQEREQKRWLIVLIISLVSIILSLIITYFVLIISGEPMYSIVFINAAIVPSIIAPITTWSISGLMIKVQKLEETHRYLATYDDLTGLMSRRAFINEGEKLLSVCEHKNQPFSLAYLDLDKFKSINDVYGHSGGDQVLIAVSTIMKNEMRDSDIIGRLGGEEFAILLPNTSLQDAQNILERIRVKTQSCIIHYLDKSINVTISAGLAGIEKTANNPFDSLVKRADDALYHSKNSGRNKITLSELNIVN